MPLGANIASLQRGGRFGDGTYKGHWPTLSAKEQLLHNQCQITASNAHAMMKNQQKPNVRWKETRSNIQSHLSVFARSCCFTNLTYCSKSQIFRNRTGSRYYQEKQSASVTWYNWGIISRILRQWSEKLENQNPREGKVQIWLWTLHTGHWQQHILESPDSSMKAHSDTVATNSRTNIWLKVTFSFSKSIWEGWQLETKNIPVLKYKWSVSAILCSGPWANVTIELRRFLKSSSVPNKQLIYSHELIFFFNYSLRISPLFLSKDEFPLQGNFKNHK